MTKVDVSEREKDQAFIGLTFEQAVFRACDRELILRIVRSDGMDVPVTRDVCDYRVNVSVVDNVIDDVLGRG